MFRQLIILTLLTLPLMFVFAATEETYYFVDTQSTSGSGQLGTLEDATGGTQYTWTATADAQYITFIRQVSVETTVNTNQATFYIDCDQVGSAGGDQIKITATLLDCAASSDCSTVDSTICSVTQMDCENGEGTPAEETGTCTPIETVISADHYIGVRVTSNTNKAGANPRIYFNTATRDSRIVATYTETVAGDTCSCPGIDTSWEIDLTDNCKLTENCDIGTGTLSFINTGWWDCDATFTSTSTTTIDLDNNQNIWINDTCIMNLG